MYQCSNCGGNLRFDIELQRLKCPYCSSDFDCYEIEDAFPDPAIITEAETDTYEVTVFSCPMCGGEIVSRDQSVSEFCSYCGQSVVLEKKLRREKRPKKIIPFQKTEEDCKGAYRRTLKKTIFAPAQLKDSSFLEKFRGIYIPYWSYSFYHKGRVKLTGKKEYRSGDYDVTEYYDVTGDVDASYEGIVFDASSSFTDELGEAIAPFDPKGLKEFVPSYLSGFYGDVADVPAKLYQDDANEIANDKTVQTISQDPAGRYELQTGKSLQTMNDSLHTQIGEPEAAMLPVWFLTWRDKDRVAYMTVNGQTGKVAADIPVDIRKYILASLLFAIPLYFLINSVFFFLPRTTLLIAGIVAFITSIIYAEEMHTIDSRDKREADRGYQYIQEQIRKRKAEIADKGNDIQTDKGNNRQTGKESTRQADKSHNKQTGRGKNKITGKGKNKQTKKKEVKSAPQRILSILTWGVCILTFIYFILMMLSENIFAALFNRMTLNAVLICAVFIYWSILLMDGDRNEVDHKIARGITGSQIAALLAGLINIWGPVSDVIYYAGILLCYLGLITTLVRIMKKYNLLITRPIPEFHNRGEE